MSPKHHPTLLSGGDHKALKMQTSIDLVAIKRPDHTFVHELEGKLRCQKCSKRARPGDRAAARSVTSARTSTAAPAARISLRRHRWKFDTKVCDDRFQNTRPGGRMYPSRAVRPRSDPGPSFFKLIVND
jgi:hypothetical protein